MSSHKKGHEKKDSQEHHKPSKFASPLPYPVVRVVAPNAFYKDLLMDDYAGMVSEFTAISQYLYHYFVFGQVDKHLADLLVGVSLVEMHHMDLLAHTIILLGGDPKIRGTFSTAGDFWNGSFVAYGTSLCQRLALDIDSEIKAICNYQEHIRLIQDPYIQELLKRIILDEQHHIKLFEQAMRKYGCA